MPEFRVRFSAVCAVGAFVIADNEEDAIRKLKEDEGHYEVTDKRYLHPLPDTKFVIDNA